MKKLIIIIMFLCVVGCEKEDKYEARFEELEKEDSRLLRYINCPEHKFYIKSISVFSVEGNFYDGGIYEFRCYKCGLPRRLVWSELSCEQKESYRKLCFSEAKE